MGSRPTIFLVVGVHDVVPNDPRHVRFIDADEAIFKEAPFGFDGTLSFLQFLNPEQAKSAPHYISEHIYNPYNADEYICENVVGYIIDKGDYGDNLTYELVQLIGGENYEDGGFIIRGNYPGAAESIRLRFTGAQLERWELALRENRVIRHEYDTITDMWFKLALEALSQAGWEIDRKDLSIMVVWDWR